ncbi:MAG: response regulator [Candidatus Thermoplasmatota archaeon]
MKKNVLIVDDDPYIIIAVRELFEDQGFEVYAANTGAECLDILKDGFEGIILMDLMMPRMDGWETIDKIVSKGYNENNIISVLTAKGLPDDENEYMRYVKDYIQKPFDPDELLKTVENYFK